MNTFIKRSMMVGFSLVFISAAVVPACAQQKNIVKGAKTVLGKKPPLTGTAPVVKSVPPRTPVTSLSPIQSKKMAEINSKLQRKLESGLWLQVTPQDKLALTNAQLRANMQVPQSFVRIEDITPVQLTGAVYLWLKNNPGKKLSHDSFLGKEIEKILSEKQPPLSIVPMLPFLRTVMGSNGKVASFTQLAQKYETYPNNVKLDEYGFPRKETANVVLDSYLLAADPVEMGAFVVNPTLLETAEIGQTGLMLTEEERKAAETLLERRLKRLEFNAEYLSPRAVLQMSYDYFVAQHKLSTGNLHTLDFAYRYRADLPFEQLTVAEKEGFIVHKLIRLQLKRDLEAFKKGIQNGMVSVDMYMKWSTDTAHLRLLDYVASKNASSILDKTDTFYNTKEGLRTVLEAYEDLRTISTRWTKYYEHDWLNNDTVKRTVELLDSDLYKTSLETRRELCHLFPSSLKATYCVR